MYPWYYVWSDRYRIFHEVLQFGARDISGVSLRPICMPQHIFNRKVEDPTQHFFTGIGIKIHCIVKILQGNKDPYVIFSDVDLMALDKNLASKLKEYESNDITAMAEIVEGEYNIGFLLLKNTPEVIAFFQKVLQRIMKENKLDQVIFNEEIKSFSGKHGFFDTKHFIQSNMIRKDIWDLGNYSIIQCLSSDHSTTKEVILGKLATIVYFYDIRHLISFVDIETMKELQQHMNVYNPIHYLCALNLESLYSTTKELPKNP